MAWPKGKPRGPRVPKPPLPEPPSPIPSPPVPPQPPSPAFEPVNVRATLVSGETLEFRATDFEVQNGRYSFTSYPEMRGFKTVRLIRSDQAAMLEITAPESMTEKLKAAQMPVPTMTAPPSLAGHEAQATMAPIVYGPPLQRPPYDGGDPRRLVKDSRAEHAANLPNAPGIPMAEISKGEEGTREVIRASMA